MIKKRKNKIVLVGTRTRFFEIHKYVKGNHKDPMFENISIIAYKNL
jgi:hypothetical protein